MILLFTDSFGKISAGTSVSEQSKSKSALALRPFTIGKYRLRRNRGYINISSCEAIKSYYALAEDYDKFLNASLALEITSKAVAEDAPATDIYELLKEYLDLLLARRRDFDTVTGAYIVKLLEACGVFPEETDFGNSELMQTLDASKVEALVFLKRNPLGRIEKLALDSIIAKDLLEFLIRYAKAHLDIQALNSMSRL